MKLQEMLPLSRKEFKLKVFERDSGKCVFCGKPADDAHHVLDRSLFKTGGYYLSNGVSVCEDHHWECEKGYLLPETIRKIAKIEEVVLPSGFDPNRMYDKWGADIGPAIFSGERTPRHTVLLP